MKSEPIKKITVTVHRKGFGFSTHSVDFDEYLDAVNFAANDAEFNQIMVAKFYGSIAK